MKDSKVDSMTDFGNYGTIWPYPFDSHTLIEPLRLNLVNYGTIEPYCLDFEWKVDERGALVQVLDEFQPKRAYLVYNWSKETRRAFHGHKKETKALFCIEGAIKVIIMPFPDSKLFHSASINHYPMKVTLGLRPKLLFIPPGFYHGWKALTEDAKLLVFSDKTLKESELDDYRLPPNYWGDEVWRVIER